MPYSALSKEWELAYNEPIPKRRKELQSWYPVSIYLAAIAQKGDVDNKGEIVDEEKPVGYVAYHQGDGVVFLGDSRTHDDWAKMGIYSELIKRRDKLVSGPKIAGLRPKRTPLKEYINFQQRMGYTINPSEEQIVELFGESYPKKVFDKFREEYENTGNSAWGIRKFQDSFSKAWLMLLKDFEPAGE